MQHLLWMIFVIRYLALHVSDYQQSSLHEHTNALYSLWDDAPDYGLVIVRNM